MTRTKTRKKKKRRRKKIGISLLLLLICILPLARAGKKTAEPDSFALVSGTVFRDPGFALPNATVTLTPNPSPGSSPIKIKKQQGVTNSRGEFVFRVPTASMRYTIRAAAKGYREDEKSVDVEGETRVEVTLSLHEESK
jgi:hypothetical protein